MKNVSKCCATFGNFTCVKNDSFISNFSFLSMLSYLTIINIGCQVPEIYFSDVSKLRV